MRLFLVGLLACASAQAALLGPISVGDVRPDLFLLLLDRFPERLDDAQQRSHARRPFTGGHFRKGRELLHGAV